MWSRAFRSWLALSVSLAVGPLIHAESIARPERIISLAPSVTEMLFAIGCDSAIVGVTTYCDYPPAARSLPKVGGFTSPNLEAILTLEPDLIVASRGNPWEPLDRLERLGIRVVAVQPQTLDEISETMRLLGRETGRDVSAEAAVRALDARIDAVAEKLSAVGSDARPRAFWGGWTDPIFTAGPGSFIHDVVERAGAVNIAEGAEHTWPQLSLEYVIARDPQVLLMSIGMGGVETSEEALAILRTRSGWRELSAVRDGRVILLDGSALLRPGPRLVDVLETLARELHPGLFEGEGLEAGDGAPHGERVEGREGEP